MALNDPMEEFLAKEKAALEALEQVDIVSSPASPHSVSSSMQIDAVEQQIGTPLYPSGSASVSASGFQSPKYSATPSTSFPTGDYARTNPASCSNTPSASSPTFTAGTARAETEAMRNWKVERAKQIAEREVIAEQQHRNQREEAKQQKEQFMRDWKRTVEEGKVAGRAHQSEREQGEGKTVWDEEMPVQLNTVKKDDVNWKCVVQLIEQLPKPSKDTTRLLKTLKSMADTQP